MNWKTTLSGIVVGLSLIPGVQELADQVPHLVQLIQAAGMLSLGYFSGDKDKRLAR